MKAGKQKNKEPYNSSSMTQLQSNTRHFNWKLQTRNHEYLQKQQENHRVNIYTHRTTTAEKMKENQRKWHCNTTWGVMIWEMKLKYSFIQPRSKHFTRLRPNDAYFKLQKAQNESSFHIFTTIKQYKSHINHRGLVRLSVIKKVELVTLTQQIYFNSWAT